MTKKPRTSQPQLPVAQTAPDNIISLPLQDIVLSDDIQSRLTTLPREAQAF